MATWSVVKVKVDRMTTPPEEPITKLQETIRSIAEDDGVIFSVLQDITDSCWVIIYYVE